MNLKEKTKEDLKYFIGIIFFNSIILANFLKMHYAQDTYCVISYGYKKIIRVAFLLSGRPITAAVFAIAGFLKLNINFLAVMMAIISLVTLSMTILILYKNILKLYREKYNANNDAYSNENKSNKNIKAKSLFIVLIMSFITIINYTTTELLVFVESGVLCIALLLCVLAACEWSNDTKIKYKKIIIFLYIATLCHQAILNIYVPLGLMFVAVKYKDNIKKAFINAFFVLLFYGIAIISGIITANIINSILNIEARQTIIPSISYIFETYGKYLKFMVLETLGIGPKYWYVIVITIITGVYFINNIMHKENKIKLVYYVVILISSILLPILPLIIQDKGAQYLESRMMLSFGASIGIMLIYTFLSVKRNNNIYKFIIVFSCFIFLINGQYIVKSSGEMIATNLLDRNFSKTIIYNIEQYEEKNNKTIKNIAVVYDSNPEYYYDGSQEYRCVNERALATEWDIIEILELYSGRKFEKKKIPEDIQYKYFEGKDWSCFDEEQLVFEEDTLYMCIY